MGVVANLPLAATERTGPYPRKNQGWKAVLSQDAPICCRHRYPFSRQGREKVCARYSGLMSVPFLAPSYPEGQVPFCVIIFL